MKIEWMNGGKSFDPPKINVDMDLDILDYMASVDKDMPQTKKNILEFRETVYRVLHTIDKNVTKELITMNLSVNELGALYLALRHQGRTKYICPYCKKSFVYEDMPVEEGDKNFQTPKSKDITKMRKET